MTELEVKTEVLARTMLESSKFGKDEGTKAMQICMELGSKHPESQGDIARAAGWLGNHSAVRQWGEKMGFVKRTDVERDALARALDVRLSAMTDPEAMKNKKEGKKG